MNNGLTMMQEFELKNGSGDIDVQDLKLVSEASSIQFGHNEVDLLKL